MIGLLVDALAHRIFHLHVHLDSLLLVMQLNGVYHVHNQVLFRKYLQVKLLEILKPSLSVMFLEPKITM